MYNNCKEVACTFKGRIVWLTFFDELGVLNDKISIFPATANYDCFEDIDVYCSCIHRDSLLFI